MGRNRAERDPAAPLASSARRRLGGVGERECRRQLRGDGREPPGGGVLGARVLGEFGDDPGRYADAKARKNYSGMSPITKASGTKRVVLARFARNRRTCTSTVRVVGMAS